MAIAMVIMFPPIGVQLAHGNKRWALAFLWLAYGTLILYLPLRFHGSLIPASDSQISAVAFLAVAGLVGSITACVWLGWYLVVSLAFNGHNNEAGGAARIGRYKQFIRLKITHRTITGYVIAVDDPKMNGRELRPRLVDVFTLTC